MFKYNNICPLARFNIAAAEDLMDTVRELLKVVKEQGVDTSEAEGMLTEAEALLESARTFSNSCITSNALAVHCQDLLKKCQEMLESKDVYAVYSALIKAKYIEGHVVKLIVIEDHTSLKGSLADTDTIFEKLPAIEQETLNNFQAKYLQQQPLADLFDLDVDVVLLSEKARKEIFEDIEDPDKGWEEFYRTYPGSQGIMALSRVGFNSEMNQALVYVWNLSASLGGEGWYVLLVKEDGVWKIQEEFLHVIAVID